MIGICQVSAIADSVIDGFCDAMPDFSLIDRRLFVRQMPTARLFPEAAAWLFLVVPATFT
jgi:hypothetical protein